MRPLSDLDGPLSHLLEARAQAELQLARAKLNVDEFLSACAVITEEAAGRRVTRAAMAPQVQAWVLRIEFRGAANAVRFSPQPQFHRHD
jgi:hypothetical protein